MLKNIDDFLELKVALRKESRDIFSCYALKEIINFYNSLDEICEEVQFNSREITEHFSEYVSIKKAKKVYGKKFKKLELQDCVKRLGNNHVLVIKIG